MAGLLKTSACSSESPLRESSLLLLFSHLLPVEVKLCPLARGLEGLQFFPFSPPTSFPRRFPLTDLRKSHLTIACPDARRRWSLFLARPRYDLPFHRRTFFSVVENLDVDPSSQWRLRGFGLCPSWRAFLTLTALHSKRRSCVTPGQ